jgi:4-aminobutyrate aminotransferase/(S)-3-amino-2-methylpropionate transaminase
MRTFHTGGVAGKDIAGGLPRVVELFEARTPKGSARLAKASGTLRLREDEGKGIPAVGVDDQGEEHEGVVPDLIALAKGIAGGLPLGAVTGRAELLDAVHAGGLGGTFGGNPIACAAALASLEIYERDDLAGAARAIEATVLPRLRALQAGTPAVADVRGRGAMLALELVRPGTLEPDKAAAQRVAAACAAQGVLVLTCGTWGNILRLLPPLVIGPDLLDDALTVLEGVF